MPPALTLAPRRLGAVNWIGLRTLYLKEVRRFAKVFTQTLVSPLVTTLLFLAIFTLALGRSVQQVGGVGYAEFLFPGLVMMSMVQAASPGGSASVWFRPSRSRFCCRSMSMTGSSSSFTPSARR